MKGIKITYWVTTGIVSLMMVYSAYAYLTEPMMSQAFQHLGYPSYFRIELAIAKLIGAALLLAPVGFRAKQWVYAGFSFVFISAFIAHTASGDPVAARVAPIVFLALLFASYWTLQKLRPVYSGSN